MNKVFKKLRIVIEKRISFKHYVYTEYVFEKGSMYFTLI